MTKKPETTSLETTIVDALHIMHDGRFLHLPVVDKSEPPKPLLQAVPFLAFRRHSCASLAAPVPLCFCLLLLSLRRPRSSLRLLPRLVCAPDCLCLARWRLRGLCGRAHAHAGRCQPGKPSLACGSLLTAAVRYIAVSRQALLLGARCPACCSPRRGGPLSDVPLTAVLQVSKAENESPFMLQRFFEAAAEGRDDDADNTRSAHPHPPTRQALQGQMLM